MNKAQLAWLSKVRGAWRRTLFHYKPSLAVTDAHISKIATCLNVKKDSEHVAAVIDTIRRFHGRKIAMAALPPGDHRDRDIKTLSNLARAMDGLNSNVLAQLARHGVDLSSCEGAHVAAIANVAKEELEEELKRTSYKRIFFRDIFLLELAEIYTTATGLPATINTNAETGQIYGPCFEFIRAAVAPIPKLKKLKDSGLRSAVIRAQERADERLSAKNSNRE